MASFNDVGEPSGILIVEFMFELPGDMKVIGNAMIMKQSCYIWLSAENGDCSMGSLAAAMPTRFEGMPISSTLINSENDLSSDMAQRLAFRFKIQVFVSWNLPESCENHNHLIDKHLITLLKKHFEIA